MSIGRVRRITLAGAGDEPLPRRARRAMLGYFLLATQSVVVACIGAGLASPLDHPTAFYAIAAVALVAMPPAALLAWRRAAPWNDPFTIAVVSVYGGLAVAGAVVAGPASPVWLASLWFPLVAVLAIGPVPLILLMLGGGAARLLVGGDTVAAETLVLLVTWSTALAVVGARGRSVLWRRLQGSTAMQEALAEEHPQARVRLRVADELRISTLEPLVRLRDQLDRTSDVRHLAALGEQLRDTIGGVRSVISELHVLPGPDDDPGRALRRLVARRAPLADVSIDLPDDLPAAFSRALGPLVRDAVSLTVGPATQRVSLDVRRRGSSIQLQVTGTPAPAIDPRTWALRWGALIHRNGVTDTTSTGLAHGGLRISMRLHGVAAPDRLLPVPGAHFRETREYVLTSRIGQALLFSSLWLVTGAGGPAVYPLVLLLACVTWIGTSIAFARTPAPTPGLYYGVLGVDAVLLTPLFLLADPALQTALLPLYAFLPATVGAWARPSLVLGLTAGLALVTAAGMATGLIVAYPTTLVALGFLLTAVVGGCEANARTRITGRLTEQMLHRNLLLGSMMEIEDAERRRLAGQLHDDALQLLLTARQDLQEAVEGAGDARQPAVAEIAQALSAIRATVSDLDVDEQAAAVAGGLANALRRTTARTRGPRVEVRVAPRAAGVHDGLVVQLVRELHLNAVKHAVAERIQIVVEDAPGGVVLEVIDDGVGFHDADAVAALHAGHIGLAIVRERIDAHNGSLEWLGAVHGTHVRITIPWSTAGELAVDAPAAA